MDKSSLKMFLVLSLTAALAIACAQDKNKKDRLTRISGGRAKVVTQKTGDAAAGPIATTRPIVAPEETTTTQCRITDSAKLDESFRKQSFCDGVEVLTATDGKIEFKEKHSLNNTEEAYAFKIEDAKLKDKKVRIEWNSAKAKNTATTKDILHLAFKIPHKESELDANNNIELYLNSVQLNVEDFVILYPKKSQENTGEVIVRIKDATKIENINFELTIVYFLK